MSRTAWAFGLAVSAAALGAGLPAAADDLLALSEIESVLVFPSSADVTRTGEIRIPQGEHRVILRGLPQGLDPNSVRIRFGSAQLTVGSVEAASAFPEGGGPAGAQALRDQLQELRDEIQAVDDRIAVAELQYQFLQSQAGAAFKPDPAGGGPGAVDPETWSAALAAIATGGQAARQAVLAAQQERRDLERQAQELELELARLDDDLAMRTDVTVALTAASAVTAPFELEYQVYNTGWNALYDARLDSEAASLTLDRKIRVWQDTGEDWSRVSLAVTTAPPTYQLQAPDVYTQYLSLMDPAPPAPRDGFAVGAAAPAPMAAMRSMDAENSLSEMAQFAPIDTVNAAFASTYGVGGLVDVLSDGLPRTFTVGQEDVAVDLVIRTAPRSSLEAFVTAKLTYEGDGPLPAGSLRLYRDGAYLREDYLDTLVPGEEIELGFGIDQQIVVTWVDEGGRESETGLVGRNTQVVEDHRFEALNRHATPFTVEIVDRRPISQDDDIQVRMSPEATPPDEEGFDDAPGVVVWRKALQPDETLSVRNAFTIVYPTNRILVGR